MCETSADAAAVQVDDAAVLPAREHDALVKGVTPLTIDNTGLLQQIERISLAMFDAHR